MATSATPEPDRLRCRGSAGAPGPPHPAGCVLSLPRPDPQFLAQKTVPLRRKFLTECSCVCLKARLLQQTSTKLFIQNTRFKRCLLPGAAAVSRGRGQRCVPREAAPGPPLGPPPALCPGAARARTARGLPDPLRCRGPAERPSGCGPWGGRRTAPVLALRNSRLIHGEGYLY